MTLRYDPLAKANGPSSWSIRCFQKETGTSFKSSPSPSTPATATTRTKYTSHYIEKSNLPFTRSVFKWYNQCTVRTVETKGGTPANCQYRTNLNRAILIVLWNRMLSYISRILIGFRLLQGISKLMWRRACNTILILSKSIPFMSLRLSSRDWTCRCMSNFTCLPGQLSLHYL